MLGHVLRGAGVIAAAMMAMGCHGGADAAASGSSAGGGGDGASSGSSTTASSSSGGSSLCTPSGPPLNADQQMAVDLVNAAREDVNAHHLYPAPGPHSAPLGTVCWAADIEAQAQAWVSTVIQTPGCGLQDAGYDNPNNPNDWGENNYSWTGADTGIVTRATQAFIAEEASYVYDWTGPFKDPSDGPMEPMPFDAQSADATPNDPTLPENQGKVIGHYTVIIWRAMSQLACAWATKPMCTQVVCFYGPGAGINELGVSPY
jgi:hypothetical protein